MPDGKIIELQKVMTDDRDFRTVRSILKGSRSAMSDLYHRHVGYLAAVCSRYVGSDEDVQDVLQTSFEKIFTSLDRFEYRGRGSVRAWMTRVTVNESMKFLREKGRLIRMQEVHEPEPDAGDADVEDIPADVLQDMIRRLPDGYRTVFNLYVMEELSHKEIASMLGISESTSASQFHRARAILASAIREYRKNNRY